MTDILNSLAGGFMQGVTTHLNNQVIMEQQKQIESQKRNSEMARIWYQNQQEGARQKEVETTKLMQSKNGTLVSDGKGGFRVLDAAGPYGKYQLIRDSSGKSGSVPSILSPEDEDRMARMLLSGDLTSSEIPGFGGPAASEKMKIMAKASKLSEKSKGTPYDVVQAEQGLKYQTRALTTQNLARIDSMGGVMDKLLKASDEAQQTNFPLINKLQQYLYNEGGSTRFTDLKTTSGILGEEIANVIAGGQATPVEILKYQTQLYDAFMNPKQLSVAVNSIRKNLEFRKNAIKSYSVKGLLNQKSPSQLPDGASPLNPDDQMSQLVKILQQRNQSKPPGVQ